MAHTILNVDDNEAGRYATSRILKQAGFEVKEASTGKEALRIAAELPDAIVMDVNLPDISGFEVCRRIKTDPATAGIPVLHLSGTYRDPYSKVRSLEGGAQAYLTQPVEPPVLIAYVKTLLRARKAEEALASEKRRLEVTLRSIGDGVITTDIQGLVGGLNRRAEELTGWLEQEAVGKPIEEVFHIVNEKTGERCENPVEKILSTREIVSLPKDTLLVSRDGTVRIIADSGAPIRDDDGNVLGAVLTFRDVTEQKQAERDLLRLSTAIHQASETILITDPEGRIVYANPACEWTTGYSLKEIIGKNPRIFKSGEQDEAFYRKLWRTITSGEVWTGHFTNMKKDGSLYEEEASISPVKDKNGKIVNYVAVKRDVTNERILELQIRQAQKMEAIGTLAGGIAHDFNNLLQIISGYSEMLLMEGAHQAPGYADIKAIRQAAVRGTQLVKQILAFSRKLEPDFRSICLNDQVIQAERLLYRTIPKMIDIELHLNQGLWNVFADTAQVEQILINLALNAKEAMPEGGKLILKTDNVVLDEEYARTHADVEPGAYVLLAVSDTGSGMEKSVSERVFEPFFSTKRPGEATGLGLAVVYGIVKNHGGHIQCSSEPRHGTTFKIYFPAMDQKRSADDDMSGESPVSGTETILVVDDESLIRELGERILNRAGYTVLKASDGEEALEIYRARQAEISLVILDLVMPKMGGQECLEKLLKINPQVKVLLASGFSVNGGIRKTLNMGAKGRVNKPFNIRDLLRTIRDVLDAR